MIPWPVTIDTDLSPDDVCRKLADVTDFNVSFVWGPRKIQYDSSAPEENSFAGEIDQARHSFRLLPHPYWMSTWSNHIKTIYQGKVTTGGEKTHIEMWVRPSVYGLFLRLCMIVGTSIALVQIYKHAWGNHGQFIPVILIVVWAIIIWGTISDVRAAISLFQKILNN